MAQPLAQAGIELLESVKDAVVLVDMAAAEALRWSVGLAALVHAGALAIVPAPWPRAESLPATKKIVIVLGRLLHECQGDMKILLALPQLTTCLVFSLFADTGNLAATSGEFAFEAFSAKCKNLLLAASTTCSFRLAHLSAVSLDPCNCAERLFVSAPALSQFLPLDSRRQPRAAGHRARTHPQARSAAGRDALVP